MRAVNFARLRKGNGGISPAECYRVTTAEQIRRAFTNGIRPSDFVHVMPGPNHPVISWEEVRDYGVDAIG
jgi:hypothetical protein